MKPEVVGAFRLALRHEASAGTLWLRRRPQLSRAKKNAIRHYQKAQKLYAKAAFLAARESVR